jgi:recombination associated protein RdgC
MWFKNLVVYRLPSDFSCTAAALEEALGRRPLQPCGALEMASRGWVPPSSTGRLLHTVAQQHLIALGVNQKLLPASIIRQEAERRAEELLEVLRDTLGSLAVQPIETRRAPHTSMGAWLLRGEPPGRFSVDQDLELRSPDTSQASVRYARHPLDGADIRGHLAAGKYPTRLGLTFRDRVSFLLTQKWQLQRVAFLELMRGEAGANDAAEIDEVEQFDSDFALMAGELSQLLNALVEALGGLVVPEQAAAA